MNQVTKCWLSLISLGLFTGIHLQAAGPIAHWDFGAEESTPLHAHGGVHRDVPGPRPPEFPDFDRNNTAVKLDGQGAHFSHPDRGAGSSFDFTNGDAITLEAWVSPDQMINGENMYVIGKGRTGAKEFPADNQNWALRITIQKGEACPSFLFATPRDPKASKPDAHWHRWTTTKGFASKTGWHHIAVAYEFGKPESIRGWIDGIPHTGQWDMGGITKLAPVTDNDAVWIGSAQGGAAANSFRGSLDSIAIHRELLNDATIKSRFRRVGGPVLTKLAPEVMPVLGELPADRVLVTFHEGMPTHDRWLNEGEKIPPETDRLLTHSFLLHRLPHRYDSWGIRESWKAPVLTRLSADAFIQPGKYQLLLRTRGLTRVWLNGKVIARSKQHADSPSGEEAITPVAKPPVPGARIAEHRQQEILVDFEITENRPSRIVLETLVGGTKFRAEPSELTLALKGTSETHFSVIGDKTRPPLLLTDDAITSELAAIEHSLSQHDDQTRRQAAKSQDEFWNRRHEIARRWANEHPVKLPPTTNEQPHPIDAFLVAKIDRAIAEVARVPVQDAKRFHSEILPLLREECFRCHGEKDRGGLKLNTREAALKAGDSEKSAVIPGKAHASELIARLKTKNAEERMPPKGEGLKPAQIALLEEWINQGAVWPNVPVSKVQVASPPLISDSAFIRRVYLDAIGIVPNHEEVREFLADQSPDKRTRLIDRLLNDERVVDHWMGYWQDVLAENPTLLNSTLNSTGPFRWFLQEALRDGKPMDRLVTELVMMRGSTREGGSAGFSIAAENDAPYAAKAHILSTAFLGIELQCARCHDSPFHSTKQKDLYGLAAMLERKPISIPKSSSVPAAFFENKPRESLIKVTIHPGTPIPQVWPFAKVTGTSDDESLNIFMQDPMDTRERLAALITAPHNTRFSQVLVNRFWRRLMGAGIVEPPSDWEGKTASHPELLKWLAHEFVAHDFQPKHLFKLIMTSQAYQREANGKSLQSSADLRFFNAPEPRRMTAEQVVDSLHSTLGRSFDTEDMTFDPDGRRNADNRINLGRPKRSWMLVSLANERDRPSLSLPKAQAIADVLDAFGWSGVRQTPRTDRETAANVLQPGVLANGKLTAILTRATDGSLLANWAVEAKSPDELVGRLYLQILNRMPTEQERATAVKALSVGFQERIVSLDQVKKPVPAERLPRVTWSNHLSPEASTIQLEMEKRARKGPPVDPRLKDAWREAYEDFVWTLINSREFVWLP